uniref:Kinesin motor domain-containing protein n=1 Tax=Macrostomum lignano TaxID=282301 RepID=A0A1I8FFT1_9PLAT
SECRGREEVPPQAGSRQLKIRVGVADWPRRSSGIELGRTRPAKMLNQQQQQRPQPTASEAAESAHQSRSSVASAFKLSPESPSLHKRLNYASATGLHSRHHRPDDATVCRSGDERGGQVGRHQKISGDLLLRVISDSLTVASTIISLCQSNRNTLRRGLLMITISTANGLRLDSLKKAKSSGAAVNSLVFHQLEAEQLAAQLTVLEFKAFSRIRVSD